MNDPVEISHDAFARVSVMRERVPAGDRLATVRQATPGFGEDKRKELGMAMAASPELLEALQRIVALDSEAGQVVLISTYLESVSKAVKDARAAISKATGGTK